MQIVIEIPEDVYKKTVFYREFRNLSDCVTTIKALENGIPLPKGHGRLIDADALNFADIDSANYGSNYIRIAPTIIEADTESEDAQ